MKTIKSVLKNINSNVHDDLFLESRYVYPLHFLPRLIQGFIIYGYQNVKMVAVEDMEYQSRMGCQIEDVYGDLYGYLGGKIIAFSVIVSPSQTGPSRFRIETNIVHQYRIENYSFWHEFIRRV